MERYLKEKFSDVIFDETDSYGFHTDCHSYYDVYFGMHRSPILEYYKHPSFFFTLDLTPEGILNLNVWEHYVCSSFLSNTGLLDTFKFLQKSSGLDISSVIGTEFLNAIYNVFLQNELCVKMLENEDELLLSAYETFINLSLKYFDIPIKVDIKNCLAFNSNNYNIYVYEGKKQEKLNFLSCGFYQSSTQVSPSQIKNVPLWSESNNNLLYSVVNESSTLLALKSIIFRNDNVYLTLSIPKVIMNAINEIYTDKMKLCFYRHILCRFLATMGYYLT